MIRTRVGYAGGQKADPTYYELGDHTESIQIDFDPKKISYSKLLEVFANTHNPCRRAWSRQYMSAIFYHNDEQKNLAQQLATRVALERGKKIETEIAPLTKFYLAEDYHQKYALSHANDFMAALKKIYPQHIDLVNSTLAMRLNAYMDGQGTQKTLRAEIDSYGLPKALREKLLSLTKRLPE